MSTRTQTQARVKTSRRSAQRSSLAPSSPSPTLHRSSISQGGSPSTPNPSSFPSSSSSSLSAATVVTPLLVSADIDYINTLQAGINVTVFYTTPRSETLCAEIQLFLVIPLLSTFASSAAGASAGPYSLDQLDLLASNLHWCAATSVVKKSVEGQKLSLATVREMKEGKSSPLLMSEIARRYPAACCFQVMGASLTLNLCAQSESHKERYMLALDNLIKQNKAKQKQQAVSQVRGSSSVSDSPIKNANSAAAPPSPHHAHSQSHGSALRRSVSEEGQKEQFAAMVAASPSPSPSPSESNPSPEGRSASSSSVSGVVSPHPNPLSPNTPASPPTDGALKAFPPADHKASVALLTAGQSFTLYSFQSDVARSVLNEERRQEVFVFFVSSAGADSPGTLHFVPVMAGQPVVFVQNDKTRAFYLNQMKQMCAGKETAILRAPIAAHASVNNCLSLFSLNSNWNLEAPSMGVRDNWMKALHQVLLRHGMKAVDKPAQAGAATNPAAAEASSSSSSSSARSSPNSAAAAAATTAAASSSSVTGAASAASSSSSLSVSTRALPVRDSAIASMNSRTINFTDPTDFFLLQSKIGEGSYGAVYKAMDYRTGKSVAIKILQFQGRDTLKLRKEIHILKQCHSEYIVGYTGAYQKGTHVWIGKSSHKHALSEEKAFALIHFCSTADSFFSFFIFFIFFIFFYFFFFFSFQSSPLLVAVQ